MKMIVDWFDILHNFVNLVCLRDVFRRCFQIRTTCNGFLSKHMWVFLKTDGSLILETH